MERSPNTLRAYAHHLKLFWDYLDWAKLAWTDIGLGQLARFQLGECPHANACLTCVHFGTSSKYLAALKDQLVQTDGILETASAQGWTRQVEMNERVRHNQLTVIAALESDDQAVVAGGQLPPRSAASFVPLDRI